MLFFEQGMGLEWISCIHFRVGVYVNSRRISEFGLLDRGRVFPLVGRRIYRMGWSDGFGGVYHEAWVPIVRDTAFPETICPGTITS